jgi:hypothetical protein
MLLALCSHTVTLTFTNCPDALRRRFFAPQPLWRELLFIINPKTSLKYRRPRLLAPAVKKCKNSMRATPGPPFAPAESPQTRPENPKNFAGKVYQSLLIKLAQGFHRVPQGASLVV